MFQLSGLHVRSLRVGDGDAVRRWLLPGPKGSFLGMLLEGAGDLVGFPLRDPEGFPFRAPIRDQEGFRV